MKNCKTCPKTLTKYDEYEYCLRCMILGNDLQKNKWGKQDQKLIDWLITYVESMTITKKYWKYTIDRLIKGPDHMTEQEKEEMRKGLTWAIKEVNGN